MLALGQAGRNQLLLDYYFLTALMNKTKLSSDGFNCFNIDLECLACPHLLRSSSQLSYRLKPHAEVQMPVWCMRTRWGQTEIISHPVRKE